MLNIRIYKSVETADLEKAGVSTTEQFAARFATSISKATGCQVTGSMEDGYVHLHTEDRNMERVSDALERRKLSHRF